MLKLTTDRQDKNNIPLIIQPVAIKRKSPSKTKKLDWYVIFITLTAN